MPFKRVNSLEYYSFDLFEPFGIKQAIFTREGGVSPLPWASLNVGGTNGDSREHVIENRKRMFDAMELPVESIFDAWQVHGVRVICADQPRPLDAPHQQADIILTDQPEVTLFMRFADCVPIFFYDPVRQVIGIAHAGWKGTVYKAVMAAVLSMEDEYGCRPNDILAGIGPSIGPDHYLVGGDVVELVEMSFGADAPSLISQHEGKTYLDLWKSNQLVLERLGVGQIELAGLCTACDINHWFSHRGEKGKTGRLGALLSLQKWK